MNTPDLFGHVLDESPAPRRRYGFAVLGIPPRAPEHVIHGRSPAVASGPVSDHAGGTARRARRKRAVCSGPYEVREAAELCRVLAERAGWTEVEVVEQFKKRGPRGRPEK